ncbi:hypothetical protein AMTR_s00105p00052770 [Amborella trichopoda]|uniref:C2H2-type domain-containing protein n=1 Tax=Amborella trichopoda TaxID=13333 RepID=W1NXG5_AMBTC|nr:hypothetical protein AMTR_s00105p00052770 [Amborella trichopoda]
MTPPHSPPYHPHFRCKVFYKIFRITGKQLSAPMTVDHKEKNTTSSLFSPSRENLKKLNVCKPCYKVFPSCEALSGHMTTHGEQVGSIMIQEKVKDNEAAIEEEEGNKTTHSDLGGSIMNQEKGKDNEAAIEEEGKDGGERECKYCHLVFETFHELDGHMALHRN